MELWSWLFLIAAVVCGPYCSYDYGKTGIDGAGMAFTVGLPWLTYILLAARGSECPLIDFLLILSFTVICLTAYGLGRRRRPRCVLPEGGGHTG